MEASSQAFRVFTQKHVPYYAERNQTFLAPVLASEVPPVTKPFPEKKGRQGEKFVEAGLLFTLGMLTHQLPARVRPGKSWLPSDWKTYFRIGLGIVIVQKINQAMDWKPPAWLGALEAVTVINPLALGVSKKSMAQYVVMAPLVTGVVQLASLINKKLAPMLELDWAVPSWVTQLGISIGMGALGVIAYPRIFKAIASKGLLGKVIQSEALKGGALATGTAMVTCARGCSPGSIICLSETAEMLGGMGSWFSSSELEIGG